MSNCNAVAIGEYIWMHNVVGKRGGVVHSGKKKEYLSGHEDIYLKIVNWEVKGQMKA